MSLGEKTLREQLIALFNDAFRALAIQDRQTERIKRLEEKVAALEQKKKDFEIIIRGYKSVTGVQIGVCEKCAGAGAYPVFGEIEECDRCDTKGWEEIL